MEIIESWLSIAKCPEIDRQRDEERGRKERWR